MERMALQNDRLFLTVYGQQVLPGDRPTGRPDPSHWRTVLVSSRVLCFLVHFNPGRDVPFEI